MLYKIKEKISSLISKGFDKWMKVYEWAEKGPLHHAAWVGGTCILPLSLFACDLGRLFRKDSSILFFLDKHDSSRNLF